MCLTQTNPNPPSALLQVLNLKTALEFHALSLNPTGV